MKIPEKIKIFAKEYWIVFDDNYCNEREVFGSAEYVTNTIYLCNYYKGKMITEAEKMNTLLHEIVHIILRESNLNKIIDEDKNENFVELFSNCLHQVLESMEADEKI